MRWIVLTSSLHLLTEITQYLNFRPVATFHRVHASQLADRLREPVRRIIAVFGPRQTGKTTLVRQALESTDRRTKYIDIDAVGVGDKTPAEERAVSVRQPRPADTQWLVDTWEDARNTARSQPNGLVLALDEIQRIAGWSETLKGLWDADHAHADHPEDLPMHVVILGSAPLLMQSGLTESLAGRFETIHVNHWSFAEMAAAFDFDLSTYLYFGGYPGAAQYVHDESRWHDYVLNALVEPNIERDILDMTRVDKPALLKQLFHLGREYSGQILSFNKMLGQLQDAGNTTTLARYLELLSTAGLLAGLAKYARSPIRTRASTPKLNVLNPALMTAGSGYTYAEAQSDRSFRGRVVESAVGAHLLSTADSNMRVYYWREGVDEVDFVLQRGPRIVAIEVKSSRNPRRSRGMETFVQRFKPARKVLVGDEGIPLNEFLVAPASRWLEDE